MAASRSRLQSAETSSPLLLLLLLLLPLNLLRLLRLDVVVSWSTPGPLRAAPAAVAPVCDAAAFAT